MQFNALLKGFVPWRRHPQIPKIVLVMQFTAIILLAACMQVSATAFGQKVTIEKDHISLKQVFKEIRKQTDYNFIYSNKTLDLSAPVSLHAKNRSVREVLNKAFNSQPLSYTIEDKIIIVKRKNINNEHQTTTTEPPQREITGVVKDSATGQPLAGVTIKVKGENIGTITDAQGKFSLEVPDGAVLEVSYLGYNSIAIPVEEKSNLQISLAATATGLNQLVVVGYGTQKKKDLTGAISHIDNEKYEDLPNTNITQALQGAVPGVSIVAGGNAGSGSAFNIRGQNSINGGNDALIVVDGIIYNGQLGDLNPEDIASIDVLKDASSAAIYGARAANGVVLITTKKGTSAKPTIQFNSYVGLQDMLMTQHLETPEQYVQKKINYQKTLAFRGVAPYPDTSEPFQYLNAAEIDNYKKGITVNPLDIVTRTAPIQNYNLSIGANTGKTNYFISGNYTDQKGIEIGDRFRRATIRTNIETYVTNWLKFGTNSSFSFVNVSGSRASLLQAINLSPYATWYLDSAKTILNPVPMTDALIHNPLMPTLNQVTKQRRNLFGILYAEIKVPFVSGLTYRFTYSNNLESSINQKFTPSFNAGGLNRVASSSNNTSKTQDMYLQNLIKYNHTFAQDHRIGLTLLYSYNFAWNRSMSENSNTFPTDALSYYSTSLGENQTTQATYSDYRAIAMMARLNYAYKGRYLITATGRRDGASVFSKNNKFAFFPSVALAWILSDEDFLKDDNFITFLKLRFSWGANGNQAINRYESLSKIEPGTEYDYVFNGQTAYGAAKTSFGNPNLKWESTYATNYGIDFGFLNGRISGSLNYYNSNTKDLLIDRSIPILNGFNSILSNLGAVNNKGIEINVNTINIDKGSFKWATGLNFSRNKNKIVHLYGKTGKNGKELNDIPNRWFIGKSLGAYYNYVPDGIWQIGDSIPSGFRPGDVKLKDMNHDGKITPDSDRAILGYDKPDFTFGFNTTIQYKGFSLYAQITGSVGGVRNNNDILMPPLNFTYRMHGIYEKWWTPENPSNVLPSLDYQNAYSIALLQSTTWVRIQDISLSYTFPDKLMKPLKIKDLNVYLSSKNPFLFTKWGGWDPETTGTGRGKYPTMRSITFGLNFSL